jgi:molybdenum cofactor biosynthesis protein B
MHQRSDEAHLAQAAARARSSPVRCAVLTVSDTRTMDTDQSGATVLQHAVDAGHRVVDRRIVPDEAGAIADALDRWIADPGVEAVLITGGSGIAPRDRTIDVLRPRLSLELEGFGELFRMLSFEQVGASAMLSRAVAGLVLRSPPEGGETLIFAMPGSVNAVETAMARLIAPQLGHLIWERRRSATKSPAGGASLGDPSAGETSAGETCAGEPGA